MGLFLLWLVLVGMTVWGTLAIYYSNLPVSVRPAAAAIFPLAAIAVGWFVRPLPWALLTFLAMFVVLTIWWLLIKPSNDRDWRPDVALLPYAEINGNQITAHNIRNCEYRTETDFDLRYYDKTFNLDKLRTADLFVVYWGLPVAHTMVSFGFDGGDYLCISIEVRKEKAEEYSAIKGFFKQYELIYIIGDERDLVRLRTNYRPGEDAYLYRVKANPDLLRKVLLDYLESVNSLKQRPEWYNAVTKNCTTSIRGHYTRYTRSPWHWQYLLNGYLARLLYDEGTIDRSLPFDELKKRSHINERAKAADKDPAFSERIREGLPGMLETGGWGLGAGGSRARLLDAPPDPQ
ncbi:MAG: DUF4105 domain-containing protein [Blastocatellia bacterium]